VAAIPQLTALAAAILDDMIADRYGALGHHPYPAVLDPIRETEVSLLGGRSWSLKKRPHYLLD
jgi:hypothetical protein